ncbi:MULTISPECIES: Rieske (2Fe-2S) protein [Streptomyces]|uniref:Cytochrome bc1 complex Rieske iron-sulfur subunit n=2 Tax=Streptomyces TaxID=1883 RepID=A0A3S9PE28_STRLT|nr:Rieske (2Fe-2S) protein [Streptomyces luteoverticillatus]AZQ70594.1 Rieske (2Fe-2S) protein [Streptomyces luteoverticillatus]
MTHSSPEPSVPAASSGPAGATRRTVVAATGAAGLAAVLAACGGSDDTGSGSDYSGSDASKGTPGQADGDKGTPGTGSTSGAGEGAGAALARTSEIPEGGGKVFPDRKVVVTQPAKGQFKAFSAVCTHQGCVVKDVANGTINCPCHGSRFSVADGAVRGGPAQKPLPEERISVNGDSITLG